MKRKGKKKMKVTKASYNVLSVDISDVALTTSQNKKVVGTNIDYEAIKRCISKSGLLRVRSKLNNVIAETTYNANVGNGESDEIEIYGVADRSGLGVMSGTLEPSNDGMKASLTFTSLS